MDDIFHFNINSNLEQDSYPLSDPEKIKNYS
jgi:hypothetical protein